MKNKDIFLVAFYGMKPRAGVNTCVKGWMEDKSNLQYDEKVEITRGLKNSAHTAKLVLNFTTKTVTRNTFNSNKDFKDLFKYFFGGYHQYMTTVMKQLDPAFMDTIVDELEAEMKAADLEAAIAIENAQAVPTE
jgi:hypothetical protein